MPASLTPMEKHGVPCSFVGGQPGSGRPRKPRVTDEMRRLVEEHAHAILSPYFASLGLELHDDGSVTRCRSAVVIGKHEGEVFASEVDDLAAQMAAARELLDRVYWRPRQSVEVAGVEDGPIGLNVSGFDLSVLSDSELQVLQRLCERSDGEER